MFERFGDLDEKISHLEGRLSDPQLVGNQKEYQKVVREHSHLVKLNNKYQEYMKVQQEILDNRAILFDETEDQEMKDLARAELEDLAEQERQLDEEMKIILLPKDPNDDKNTFLEIRAGTGGDEAALFTGDLFRMYSRFAENMG